MNFSPIEKEYWDFMSDESKQAYLLAEKLWLNGYGKSFKFKKTYPLHQTNGFSTWFLEHKRNKI